jgi:hypothetical protein
MAAMHFSGATCRLTIPALGIVTPVTSLALDDTHEFVHSKIAGPVFVQRRNTIMRVMARRGPWERYLFDAHPLPMSVSWTQRFVFTRRSRTGVWVVSGGGAPRRTYRTKALAEREAQRRPVKRIGWSGLAMMTGTMVGDEVELTMINPVRS